MRRNTETKKKQSNYNPNRSCYLSEDGMTYCYEWLNPATQKYEIKKCKVGKDGLTTELTFLLDEMDHDEDLNERYASEHQDMLFNIKNKKYDADNSDDICPWDTLGDMRNNPEKVLFSENEVENPDITKVHQIINERCTESQQKFIYEHFGKCLQLEEMRQLEIKKNRKKNIIFSDDKQEK